MFFKSKSLICSPDTLRVWKERREHLRKDAPILIYDGDCGFCQYWINRWRKTMGDLVETAPYQEVSRHFPEIPEENFRKAVQLVEIDGRVSAGAEAVFRAFGYNPEKKRLLWMYEKVPGFRFVSELGYSIIAYLRGGMLLYLSELIWGKG